MSGLERFIAGLVLILSAIDLSAQTSSRPAKPVKGRFDTVRIVRFDVDPKVTMSKERLNVLMLEIGDELYKIKKFKTIIEPPTSASGAPGERELRLTGTVTEFYSLLPDGSPKVMGSELFGNLKMKIAFADPSSGEVLLEREISKRIVAGPYQLKFKGLTRRAAQELAETAKKTFF